MWNDTCDELFHQVCCSELCQAAELIDSDTVIGESLLVKSILLPSINPQWGRL